MTHKSLLGRPHYALTLLELYILGLILPWNKLWLRLSLSLSLHEGQWMLDISMWFQKRDVDHLLKVQRTLPPMSFSSKDMVLKKHGQQM
mgnify:CR=1 FL=1